MLLNYSGGSGPIRLVVPLTDRHFGDGKKKLAI